MSEQVKQEQKPSLHPMASSMFAFVNEALTLEELKARLSLMEGVIKNIHKELEELEKPAPAEEAPEAPAEMTKEEKIAAYAASLEEGAE